MVRLQTITVSDFAVNNIRLQCSELSNNMLQELIMANKGMAWFYSKHRSKVPYWPWAKKDQKIWWHPCKHSKLYYRFKHGRNRIMKACSWARCTHYRALHDKISIASARRHVCETNQGKNKFIACKDQLQQPWPNWITCKQSARKHFEAKVEHKNDMLDYSINANKGMNV